MRFRNTLVLAFIFILLGAYVYFFELPKEGKGKSQKLLDLKQEEVEGIVLSYSEQEIRLQREPSGKWKITHPLPVAADDSTISSVLSALNASEIKRVLEEKPSAADLKGYGLDQPEVKVSITLKSGITLPVILVGARTPVGNSAYVRRGAEPTVLLTDATLRSSLERKLNDFRDKKILDFKEESVKQLALKGTKGDFALNKKGEDWFIERPKSDRADQAEIRGMLSTIRNMSAQDFVEEAPSELKTYGLDKPRLQISVFLGEKEGKREILFGNKREGKDDVYLVLDSKGTVYTVYESVLKQLEKDLSALRDKEMLPFLQDKAARLQIQTPKETLVLAKGEKEEWKVEAPRKGKAKPEVVADYLARLSRLKAKGFADDEPKGLKQYGLDPPSLKIIVSERDGKNLGTLLVGSKAGMDYYAGREGNATVYIVDEFSYNQLNKQLADFLEEEKKDSPSSRGTKK